MNQKILKRIEKFPRIISELEKSENEILAVSAWFTDENLFDILLKKQQKGVKVKLIIEQFFKTESYMFSDLSNAGGEIYRIEKEDFGMMHKKYCIVDEKIAIFPLVIRSSYVLLNNHESLIVTGHSKTVQNLKKHFYKIKSNATKHWNNSGAF